MVRESRILQIHPLGGHEGYHELVLDSGEAFRVRSEDVPALDLQAGATVNAALLEQLRDGDAAIRAVEKAYRFLSVRMRSRRELEDRLRRYGFADSIIRGVFSRLEGSGFIDDERFASAWVRGRIALRPSGAGLLRRELFQKGIAREVIDRTLREMLSVQDEKALARQLAQARQRIYRRLPPPVAFRRLAELLQRRGFSPGVIAAVLRETLGQLSPPLAG